MKTKRILSVFLAAILLLMFAVPVSAAETVHSEVYSDLSMAMLNGERFDFADYPKNTADSGVYLLTLNERGYLQTDLSDYDVYIYLYNPSARPLDVSSVNNQIQLATDWTDTTQAASRYAKFNLEIVSVTHEEGYEYLFYKARISTEVGGIYGIEKFVDPLGRFYDISGIEVQKMGVSSVSEYAVGMRYAVYGTEAANNKTTKVTQIDTLSLEVHHTYFRTESSSAGVNHANQLNAVYFNVPAEYWVSYDYLNSIECAWSEYRTTPIIVTDNADVAAHLVTWRGRGNGEGYNASNPVSLYSGMTTATTESPAVRTYDWTYNTKLADNNLLVEVSKENCDRLTWSFLVDEIELRQTNVTSQEILDYYNTHKDDYGDYLLTEEGVSDEFPNRKAGYQQHSIVFDETFTMASYASNHGWLDRLWNYNIFNGGAGTNLKDDYSGILAIQEVSTAHVNLRAEELATRYYINPDDADDFKAVVDQGKANGMKTIVFRFAVTDYFSEEITATVNGVTADGTTYRAEQTAFIGFDIISLTFSKAGDLIVIPVSSSPTDIIGGIDSPQVDADAGLGYVPDYIKDAISRLRMQRILLQIAALLIIFVVIYAVMSSIKPDNPVVIKINDSARQISQSVHRKRKKSRKRNQRKNGGDNK